MIILENKNRQLEEKNDQLENRIESTIEKVKKRRLLVQYLKKNSRSKFLAGDKSRGQKSADRTNQRPAEKTNRKTRNGN